MRRPSLAPTLLLGALAFLAIRLPAEEGTLKYPKTHRGPQVDDFHGTRVADPYRWLEDDVRKSKEVADWVAAQNRVTFGFLDAIPQRKAVRDRLTKLWNYERYSAPEKHGGRYFFTRNDGLQNQAVLYTVEKLDGKPRVLLDPNKLSKDGTVALVAWEVTNNGKHLAYSLAEAGSDWQTWRVLDIASGKPLSDEVKWVKFSGATWDREGKGFFYGRYPEARKGGKFIALNLNQKVYYHKVGTPQAEDKIVHQRADQPTWGFRPHVTDDGKYLILTIWKGTDRRYRIAYKDLTQPDSKPIDLIDNFANEYTFLDNVGPIFYFRTDLGAPRRRIIAIDITRPAKENWKEIIPQSAETLSSTSIVGESIVCSYLKDARSLIKVYKLNGQFVGEVALPGIGSATGFAGKRSDFETFYTFSSFATPPTTYRYDLKSGKNSLFRRPKAAFNPDDYVTEQVFYSSKDGTRVPMFITYKKGLKKDGSNPTILYGYGGFNIPLPPNFRIERIAWLEMGGIYAQANLRGGGEYGKEWHQAGTKAKKQNVFDDFIAAAEYLIAQKYTSTPKLAIKGGSNGGLLVGAVMTQRPDLFGACLPAVGVMDMLRFHKFTAGRFWVDDYGSADNAADFKALYAYSPYHNLKKGTKYPPTLVTTADTDDRVVPGHSFKFTAMLQYCHGGDAPVLARIETSAGHGAGKPTAKIIAEVADEVAFLIKVLGMRVPAVAAGR